MDNSKETVKFFAYWVVNSLLLLILSTLFSGNIVLGNANLSRPLAGVLSGLILVVVLYAVPVAISKAGFKIKNKNAWPVIFFVANLIIIWLIKKVALTSGLGISNIFWVIIASAIITLGEWALGKTSQKLLKA